MSRFEPAAMATASEVPLIGSRALPSGGCLRLSDIDWKTYSRVLAIFAERPAIRLTYDQGELEIMSPLFAHDDDSWFVGDLVFVLTEELGLPLKRGGSTTLRRQLLQRGIEADACYWITNAHRMKGVRRLDLRRHPPPDLALEVDVTQSSLDRLDIYAALGVPELWRLDGNILTFYVLDDTGHYSEATASKLFPLVKPAHLLKFVRRARKASDENSVTRDFREWIRKRIAKQA